MFLAEEAGFIILATIHDEIVTEVPIDSPLGLEDLLACMTKVPEWGSDDGIYISGRRVLCTVLQKVKGGFMKIEARPVYLGNSFTVWIGNYRLMFQGTRKKRSG